MKSINTLNQDTARIELTLEGEDAARFLEFQKRERFKRRAPAAYKLIMDGLDKSDKGQPTETSIEE